MSGIINEIAPFGFEVKLELMKLNKTQEWLSKETGISKSDISRLIRGMMTNPTKEEKIMRHLAEYKAVNSSPKNYLYC